MVNAFGWRSIFLINLPIGILGFLLTFRCVAPSTPQAGRSLDLPGQVASIVALGMLTFALIEGINDTDATTIVQVASACCASSFLQPFASAASSPMGGEAANIIPIHMFARYDLSVPMFDELLDLRARVTRCFEAGALATGASLSIIGGDKPYAQMVQNAALSELYRLNAEALGRVVQEVPRSGAGTDMGNISQVIPSIQPHIGINCLPAINHQPEFATACVTPEADKAVLDGALAMAWTTIDLALDHTLRDQLMQK